MLETPVLLATYNRLDTVKKVFEQIRKVQPKKLYLASDGGKKEKAGDIEKVETVRKWMVQAVDWECEISTRFSDINQGCQRGMANAISWVLEKEEETIILEDDIVADESFFYFCQEMLKEYSDDTRVMMVSGYKRIENLKIHGDYFFSSFCDIWGWATWKRAWKYFDVSMKKWPQYKKSNSLQTMLRVGALGGLTEEFDRVYAGKLNSWAYPWFFSMLCNSGLEIVPSKNLIKNIGFDSEEATHTKGTSINFKVEKVNFPMNQEENVLRNYEYDEIYGKRFYRGNSLKKIIRKFIPKRILQHWYKFRGVH